MTSELLITSLMVCSLLSALPMSWSMSINLSRKSFTEATLRRMMGWRGAIHCSFPWPSWRPKFPTLCRAWRPQRQNIHSTLTSSAHQITGNRQNSVWVTAYLKVRDQKGPWGQACCEALCPAHTWPRAKRKSLSTPLSDARLWTAVWLRLAHR